LLSSHIDWLRNVYRKMLQHIVAPSIGKTSI